MLGTDYALITVGLLDLLLGLVVLTRNHRKLENQAFALIAFSIAAWCFGILAYQNTDNESASITYASIFYSGAISIGLGLTLFAKSVTSRDNSIKALILLSAPAIIIIAILASPIRFLFDGIIYVDNVKTVNLKTFDYAVYSLAIITYIVSSIAILARSLKSLSGSLKIQTKYHIIAISTASVFGLAFNLVLPWKNDYSYIWLGPVATCLFLGGMAYNILHNKLFDIRAAIARALAYLATVFLLSLFLGAVTYAVLSSLISASVGTQEQTLIITTASIASALSFQPMRRRLDRISEKLFYRTGYDTQSLIDQLSQLLATESNLESILSKTTRLLYEQMKPSSIRFFAYNGKLLTREKSLGRYNDIPLLPNLSIFKSGRLIVRDDARTSSAAKLVLDEHGYDIIVPLKSEDSVIGLIGLGSKESGLPYTRKDTDVLRIAMRELTIAVQNAHSLEEINKLNETLQFKIDIATRELKSSNAKLQELDEAKDEFISMASHQIRTPLTSVKGYLSMVLEGDAGEINENQKKLLKQAFISSQRMVYLVADLLNASRLKTGKFTIETTDVDLDEMIRAEIDQLQETAAARSLEIVYKPHKNFPKIQLDENKTRQVVMNFLDNAIYYSKPNNQIKIDLKASKHTVSLTVTDSGIGVPKNDVPKLFSKFYRAANARKARPDGTGLGLFMAKKVIVAQGGSIIFKSKENQGSTFGFTFPLKPAAPKQPDDSNE